MKSPTARRLTFMLMALTAAVSVLSPLPASSDVRCEPLFESAANLKSQFAGLEKSDLTASESAAVSRHGIMKLKKELAGGKGITFAGLFIDVESSPQYKGEWTYTQEAVRYLKYIFPEAKFVNDSKTVPKTRKRLDLLVMDPSEGFSKKYAPAEYDLYVTQGGSLPIPFMKALRAWDPDASKSELRTKFGVGAKQKVLSLYVRAPDTMTDINPRSAYNHTLYDGFFKSLRSAFAFDVLIVTFGNHDRYGYEYTGIEHSLDGFRSVRWYETADIKGESIENGTIIVNGTTGLVPHIHKAADIAVVIGPVNFFEPLAVGTPTLIFRKPGSETRLSNFSLYDEKIYDQLISTAMTTGLAETTGSIAQIAPKVRTLIARTSKKSFEAASIKENAVPPFLDALDRHVRYLLIHGKTPSPDGR